MKNIFTVIVTFIIVVFSTQNLSMHSNYLGAEHRVDDIHLVDIYPSYGYLDDNIWVVPIKFYVYEHRGYLEDIILSLFQRLRELTPDEKDTFLSRMQTFIADSESREIVEFVFDQDPNRESFIIRDSAGNPIRSNIHGIVEGEIHLSTERALFLFDSQNSHDYWLTFSAISEEHMGRGKIRLINPEGTSVISDIDDTIKITEMPAGSGIVVRNALFKEYRAAQEMLEIFDQWRGKPIHYVSGTPRQFYRPLSEFMMSGPEAFPEGTFHLRDVRKNLLSLNTWSDLEKLIRDENGTHNYKFEQIIKIMQHFPERSFILVGDSGQYDPEIFREVESLYSDRIKQIVIRDIVNDREHNPKRLEGMTIIPANTVTYGTSQFE